MTGTMNPTNNEGTTQTILNAGGLRIEMLQGSKKRPVVSEFNVRNGQYVLEVNLQGTQLMRESEHQPWRVLPPKSIAFFRGPASVMVHVGRGDHKSLLCSWPDTEMPGLTRWVERAANTRRMTRRFSIVAFNPITFVEGDVATKLIEACKNINLTSEPTILAAIHEMVLHAMTSDNEFSLSALPPDLPATMHPLVEQVRQDPAASWSLKEASTLAGYSPFHLSRTFKAIVGFGFPEFVDRCRTEIAVVQLCNTDRGIEEIAANCGFGSPQALRESVKEYLGMLPSELRIHAGLNLTE